MFDQRLTAVRGPQALRVPGRGLVESGKSRGKAMGGGPLRVRGRARRGRCDRSE